jgi:hypothetical protein
MLARLTPSVALDTEGSSPDCASCSASFAIVTSYAGLTTVAMSPIHMSGLRRTLSRVLRTSNSPAFATLHACPCWLSNSAAFSSAAAAATEAMLADSSATPAEFLAGALWRLTVPFAGVALVLALEFFGILSRPAAAAAPPRRERIRPVHLLSKDSAAKPGPPQLVFGNGEN